MQGWRSTIWHNDTLRVLVETVNISLIKYEANIVVPRRGHRVEIHPLSENLAETVELAQGADPHTSEPADTTLDDSTHAVSWAPRSSRSTPLTIRSTGPSSTGPKVRGPNGHLATPYAALDAKIYHRAEDRIEKRVAHQNEQKIRAFHQCLGATGTSTTNLPP